jgi:mRNA-degrading endonuclease RelE of RelBE toxin-antitoxin system
MKYELEIKAVAIRQAAEAYDYYQRKVPGLGERFIGEIVEAYATLGINPSFQVRKPPVRYLTLRKFPYRLIYEVQGSTVIVYQVRHLKRKSHRKYGP